MAQKPRGGIKWLVAILAGGFLGARGVLGILGVVWTDSPWTDVFFCVAAIGTAVLFVVYSRHIAAREDEES
jgi:hypothetical protein